uniref:Uncharacterized protein n=1 Tax=Cyanoderma ruficeps TaxID=181631 RepID=A0A8C3P350_9PASS
MPSHTMEWNRHCWSSSEPSWQSVSPSHAQRLWGVPRVWGVTVALLICPLCAVLPHKPAVAQGGLLQGRGLPKLSPKPAASPPLHIGPWGVWAKVTAVAGCQRWREMSPRSSKAWQSCRVPRAGQDTATESF